MEKKAEMKRLRNRIRSAVKHWEADWASDYTDYTGTVHNHKDWCNRLRIEMVKWCPNDHRVLLKIYDASKPMSNWDTPHCRWVWVYTYPDSFDFYKVWEAANKVACNFDREVGNEF